MRISPNGQGTSVAGVMAEEGCEKDAIIARLREANRKIRQFASREMERLWNERNALQDRIDILTCKHQHSYFDRELCPEPCGSMHYRCDDCGKTIGGCPLE